MSTGFVSAVGRRLVSGDDVTRHGNVELGVHRDGTTRTVRVTLAPKG